MAAAHTQPTDDPANTNRARAGARCVKLDLLYLAQRAGCRRRRSSATASTTEPVLPCSTCTARSSPATTARWAAPSLISTRTSSSPAWRSRERASAVADLLTFALVLLLQSLDGHLWLGVCAQGVRRWPALQGKRAALCLRACADINVRASQLHVSFHGCQQYYGKIGNAYVTKCACFLLAWVLRDVLLCVCGILLSFCAGLA